MKKEVLTILVILLLIGMCVIPSTGTINIESYKQVSSGNTLYVGGSGPNNYTKIQDAINDANPGDMVFIYKGTYHESLIIHKPIALIGEDKLYTIVDPWYSDAGISIDSDNVEIHNLQIINCKDWVIYVLFSENLIIDNNICYLHQIFGTFIGRGIKLVHSSYNIISNNLIYDTYNYNWQKTTAGISLEDNSNNNVIINNEIYEYLFGIDNEGDNNHISNNKVYDGHVGVDIEGNNNDISYNKIWNNSLVGLDIEASNNQIISNTIWNNGPYCIWPLGGIAISEGGNNYFEGNTIFNNGIAGIYIRNCDNEGNNIIVNNSIYDNGVMGIYSESKKGNIFKYNNISNHSFGAALDYSKKNIFTKNNFINNEISAYFYSFHPIFDFNMWFNNYWSDYNSDDSSPKIIHGERVFMIFSTIPWIKFDFHPAQEPYDIEV